jgi:hypothetical protein
VYKRAIRPSRTSATSIPLTAGGCSGTPRLKARRPRSWTDVDRTGGAEHEAWEAEALAKQLKSQSYRFVGPTKHVRVHRRRGALAGIDAR